VGVNRFMQDNDVRLPVLRVDEELQRKRTARLDALRARRDGAAVERSLSAVEQAARSETNLIPPILAAVESYATLGEISHAVRKVFGVHKESFAF
jgi:methylmalonyl-CoA mutase N-terminal domain/subunit